MHNLFGEIQIPEETYERGQNPARFRPVKSLNGPADVFGPRRLLRALCKQLRPVVRKDTPLVGAPARRS